MEHEKIVTAVKEALEKSPQRKFKESIDLAINLKNLDMNQPQNRFDEEIILPNGVGKQIKIAVFAKGETGQRAKAAGADYVLDPEEINVLGEDKARAKSLAEDVSFFIAESAYMPLIGKTLGPVLGPRGKMPIPLTADKDVVQIITKSRNSIKVRSKDKMTFHISIGKKEMDPVKLSENIEAIINRIEHKYERGLYNVKSIYVKSTMGPAVRVI
ncbi:MAG: 50S ribosomal protein L1 [Candidatus Methanoperedens sp.]|nr:50S ribosomal protein L1 [Candidatus Methanoperedens sp.]MCE8425852.1 50S ribosomal protein L1 [Candidatus Methanoperedens sp.]MCE8427630.1 50S ribosomal protein L1 [Candidatus Methanoperedens sp.]